MAKITTPIPTNQMTRFVQHTKEKYNKIIIYSIDAQNITPTLKTTTQEPGVIEAKLQLNGEYVMMNKRSQ